MLDQIAIQDATATDATLTEADAVAQIRPALGTAAHTVCSFNMSSTRIVLFPLPAHGMLPLLVLTTDPVTSLDVVRVLSPLSVEQVELRRKLVLQLSDAVQKLMKNGRSLRCCARLERRSQQFPKSRPRVFLLISALAGRRHIEAQSAKAHNTSPLTKLMAKADPVFFD